MPIQFEFLLNSLIKCLSEPNQNSVEMSLNSISKMIRTRPLENKFQTKNLVPSLIDLLGDQRYIDKSLECLSELTRFGRSPLIAHFSQCATHKNSKVRECMSLYLEKTASDLEFSVVTTQILPFLIQVFEDVNQKVRDAVISSYDFLIRVYGDSVLEETKKKTKSLLVKVLIDKNAKKLTSPLGKRQPLGQLVEITGKQLFVEKKKDMSKELNHFVNDQWKDGCNMGFAELIKDVKTEWTDRIAAMIKFREFTIKNCSNYKDVLKHLQDPISTQISELRSTIVQEVCTMLQIIVEQMKDEFEPFAEHFVPVLLKTTFVTKKAIADPGNSCIVTILQHSKIGRALVDLCEPLGTRKSASVLRKRCIEYLTLYLSIQKTNYLEYYLNSIEGGLRAGLACEVRDVAKKAYQEYSRHWPERVNKFIVSLDLTTQQYMKKTPTMTYSKPIEKIAPIVKKKFVVEDMYDPIIEDPKPVEIKPYRKPSPEIIIKKMDPVPQLVTKRDSAKEAPKASDISVFLKKATTNYDTVAWKENLHFLSTLMSRRSEICNNLKSIMNVLLDGMKFEDEVVIASVACTCELIAVYPKEMEVYLNLLIPLSMNNPKLGERLMHTYNAHKIAQEYFLLLANGKLDDESIEFILKVVSLSTNPQIIEYCMEVLFEIEKEGINGLATQLLIVIQKNYSTQFQAVLDMNPEMSKLFMDLSIIEEDIVQDEDTRELSKHFLDFQNRLMQNTQDEIQIALNDMESDISIAKLDNLIKLSQENHSNWNIYFNKTLLLVLDVISKNPSDEMREYGLLLLNALLKNQSSHFSNSECLILQHIFDLYKSKNIKISCEARNAGVTFLEHLEPEKTCPILLDMIKKKDNQAIGFELLETFAQRIPREIIRDFMAVLIESIDTAPIEVRKNAIFCLVKISNVLGDDFWSYFKTFDSRQIKMVRHYIAKTLQ